MNKLIGYVLAVLGLLVVVLSLNSTKIKMLESVKPAYIMIVGIVLVILGVVLVISKGKETQAEEEVPIYKGKKIVGYRKQK